MANLNKAARSGLLKPYALLAAQMLISGVLHAHAEDITRCGIDWLTNKISNSTACADFPYRRQLNWCCGNHDRCYDVTTVHDDGDVRHNQRKLCDDSFCECLGEFAQDGLCGLVAKHVHCLAPKLANTLRVYEMLVPRSPNAGSQGGNRSTQNGTSINTWAVNLELKLQCASDARGFGYVIVDEYNNDERTRIKAFGPLLIKVGRGRVRVHK